MHGEARHWGLLNTQKWLPDMGKTESPVRKTFFHRHLWVAAAMDGLDDKDFWHDPGGAWCQVVTGQHSPEAK